MRRPCVHDLGHDLDLKSGRCEWCGLRLVQPESDVAVAFSQPGVTFSQPGRSHRHVFRQDHTKRRNGVVVMACIVCNRLPRGQCRGGHKFPTQGVPCSVCGWLPYGDSLGPAVASGPHPYL